MRISFPASEIDRRGDGFGSSITVYLLRRTTSKTNHIADQEHMVCLKDIAQVLLQKQCDREIASSGENSIAAFRIARTISLSGKQTPPQSTFTPRPYDYRAK